MTKQSYDLAATARDNESEPMGFRDGELVPLRQLAVPVSDAGLVHGVCVSEQVRTFGQQPFLLDRHYARWIRGLELIGAEPPCTFNELASRIDQLIQLNSKLLPEDAEQGICFFATPGNQSSFMWSNSHLALNDESLSKSSHFFAHTYPLPIEQWQASYENGVPLVTAVIRDVSAQSWPKGVKIRSRLHYYLAQQFASEQQCGAFPILVGDDGSVSDSSIASIAGYTPSEGLIVMPQPDRFASISIEFVVELAKKLGMAVTECNFSMDELKQFDEVFLASTPWCIFPVATIDHHGVRSSFPIYQRLAAAWSDTVGFTNLLRKR